MRCLALSHCHLLESTSFVLEREGGLASLRRVQTLDLGRSGDKLSSVKVLESALSWAAQSCVERLILPCSGTAMCERQARFNTRWASKFVC
jgi:hypothetical protein